MKTVLYVESGSGHGGAPACLASLLKCLDRRTYRPLVAYYHEGVGIKRIQKMGVATRRVSPRRAWWELVRLMQRERVDVVHFNNELYSHVPGILAARWMRRPCVVHLRGIRPLTRRERWAIPLVRQFIVISKIARHHYLADGLPAPRTTLVYDGVDLSEFDGQLNREAARRAVGAGPNDLVIGMVSRLVPKKGQQDLLEALARLSRELPQVRGVLVGGDTGRGQRYLKTLQRHARALGLDERVVFTGWRGDIPQLTAGFDIAAQASHYTEGFGTSVMEAMALGKPVVATAVGGIPELVEAERTGLLVPPGQPVALAHALRRLVLNPDERLRMGRAGRARVEQLFDQRHQVMRLEAVYRRLLGEERS